MPIYEYRCDCGRTVEVLVASGSPAPTCSVCGAETRKLVSGFAVGGRADAGLPHSRMPQTWKGTYDGNSEYVTNLQRQWERRQRLEDRYPELAGDVRPVVAHEGRYSVVPLRAGEPAATTPGEGLVGGGPHHPHPHGHPHSHSELPTPPAASL
jgi:putative FmdB family regulatory protein